jgi:deoxyadenosine/deoxycytidine kinase
MRTIICVEGNIGVGKSTALRMLRDDRRQRVIPEAVDRWQPFADRFYANPHRWALALQMAVVETMAARDYRKYNDDNDDNGEDDAEADDDDDGVVFVERSIASTLLFVERNLRAGYLTTDEAALVRRFAERADMTTTSSRIVHVVLAIDDEECLRRVRARARPMEAGIDIAFLAALRTLHDERFADAALRIDATRSSSDIADELLRIAARVSSAIPRRCIVVKKMTTMLFHNCARGQGRVALGDISTHFGRTPQTPTNDEARVVNSDRRRNDDDTIARNSVVRPKNSGPLRPDGRSRGLSPLRVTIEGNIGAGKTTLLDELERRGYAVARENLDALAPALPLFYANPQRWAFMLQLVAMDAIIERDRAFDRRRLADMTTPTTGTSPRDPLGRTEHQARAGPDRLSGLSGEADQSVVVFYERSLASNGAFAAIARHCEFLDDDELALLERVRDRSASHAAISDKTYVLDTPIDMCAERILRRGRKFEAPISASYLRGLRHAFRKLRGAVALSGVPDVSSIADDLIQKLQKRKEEEEEGTDPEGLASLNANGTRRVRFANPPHTFVPLTFLDTLWRDEYVVARGRSTYAQDGARFRQRVAEFDMTLARALQRRRALQHVSFGSVMTPPFVLGPPPARRRLPVKLCEEEEENEESEDKKTALVGSASSSSSSAASSSSSS